jgi:hypothetical protein
VFGDGNWFVVEVVCMSFGNLLFQIILGVGVGVGGIVVIDVAARRYRYIFVFELACPSLSR